MARAKNDNPRYNAKDIKRLPGLVRRLFTHVSADYGLLVRRLQRESVKWPGREKALYLPGAKAMAPVMLSLLETVNLATSYAHITVTEIAARCGLRTKGKAGYKSHSRALHAIEKLAAAGFIEYNLADFDNERQARDPAFILLRPEFFIFMGARPDVLEKEQGRALARLLAEHKRKAENLECEQLPDEPVEACIELRRRLWANYNKVRAERVERKKQQDRLAHARTLKPRVSSLALMAAGMFRQLSGTRSTADKVRAARRGQGLLFDVGSSPPVDHGSDGIPF